MTSASLVTNPSGNVDKKALVDQFMPYVRSIAKQIKSSLSPRIELDDLVGYGMTGLLEAADRFDPKFGANFSTFSYYRIRGAIYDGLRGMGYVNRTEYQKIRFSERANAYLENRAHRDLSGGPQGKADERLEELANQVNQLITIYVTSLEAMGNVEFEDQKAIRSDTRVENDQTLKMLHEALKGLSAEDQKLIALYYFQDLSLEEVGKNLGLSKSWTCRKHAQVIEKLSEVFQKMHLGTVPIPALSKKRAQV
jgi:RNA polymerase sigma factor for flagellar operon FliA